MSLGAVKVDRELGTAGGGRITSSSVGCRHVVVVGDDDQANRAAALPLTLEDIRARLQSSVSVNESVWPVSCFLKAPAPIA